MPYRLRTKEAVEEALRRVALEQFDAAIQNTASDDRDAAVHDVRKHCKKLRGLLRLVRPAFEGFRTENNDYRDIARLLAGTRDAAVRLETFEKLIAHAELDGSALQPVREQLERERDAAVEQGHDAGQKLDDARLWLLTARGRIVAWELDASGYDAVCKGLEKTYTRARKAMADAREDPTVENLHEWRKRVKYHWYHCRLLRNVWREMMTARRNEAKILGDLLGDDHDLAVLACHLRDATEAGDVRDLLDALDRRRAGLQRDAFERGSRMFAEKPGAFVDRIGAYWKTWR